MGNCKSDLKTKRQLDAKETEVNLVHREMAALKHRLEQEKIFALQQKEEEHAAATASACARVGEMWSEATRKMGDEYSAQLQEREVEHAQALVQAINRVQVRVRCILFFDPVFTIVFYPTGF